MTDQELVYGMLARANIRYNVAVCATGTYVTTRGRRGANPFGTVPIEFEFTPEGELKKLYAEMPEDH